MKLVIIGGVAGGMSAATRARRLDEHAQITVYEGGPYVSFANCGLPYHLAGEIKDRSKLLLHTPQSLDKRAALDVRINTMVTAIDPAKKELTVRNPDGSTTTDTYDKLILSPGAEGIVPPIPGADLALPLRTIDQMDQVIAQADRAQNQAAAAGKRPSAVVLGAGFIGLETVEALVHRGFDVALIDMADHVLPPLDADLAPYVEKELTDHGVTVVTGAAATTIEDEGAQRYTVTLDNGDTFTSDLVIMSVGVRPRSQLAKAAGLDVTDRGAIIVDHNHKTSDDNIYAVGDAIEVTFASGRKAPVLLAGPANRQGRRAADAIMGKRTTPQQPVLGTAVVRVFDQVAAVTGTGRKELEASGVDFEVVRLHAGSHAGYYPGAETIHMMGYFAKDGKLLGAAAVGKDGADKRIDVLATAIRAGMTADDLAELELCYSPPIGAAKDPINMLGFVAQNALDGTCPQWQPDQLDYALENGFVLDVRNPGERERYKVEGSYHVPLPELRGRIDEVRLQAGDRTIYVHCASGLRSYLATRILIGNGMNALNLAGGADTLVSLGK